MNVAHTVLYYEQPTDISSPVILRPDPEPTVQGTEYFMEGILKHSMRSRGFQSMSLMTGNPSYEAN